MLSKIITYTLVVPPYMALVYFLHAWVVCSLWGWFVVPFGLPALTYYHAVGISLLVGVLSDNGIKAINPDKLFVFLYPLINPFILYFFGYVLARLGGF